MIINIASVHAGKVTVTAYQMEGRHSVSRLVALRILQDSTVNKIAKLQQQIEEEAKNLQAVLDAISDTEYFASVGDQEVQP